MNVDKSCNRGSIGVVSGSLTKFSDVGFVIDDEAMAISLGSDSVSVANVLTRISLDRVIQNRAIATSDRIFVSG